MNKQTNRWKPQQAINHAQNTNLRNEMNKQGTPWAESSKQVYKPDKQQKQNASL